MRRGRFPTHSSHRAIARAAARRIDDWRSASSPLGCVCTGNRAQNGHRTPHTLAISLFILSVATAAMGGCAEPTNRVLAEHDIEFVLYDYGSSAPHAPAGGPSLVVWSNGQYVVSERYPLAGGLSYGVINVADAKALSAATQEVFDNCQVLYNPSCGEVLALTTPTAHLEMHPLVLDESSGVIPSRCVILVRTALSKFAAMRASPERPIDDAIRARLVSMFGPGLNRPVAPIGGRR